MIKYENIFGALIFLGWAIKSLLVDGSYDEYKSWYINYKELRPILTPLLFAMGIGLLWFEFKQYKEKRRTRQEQEKRQSAEEHDDHEKNDA